MRCHPDAVNLLVVDSDRVDLVAVKQRRHQLVRSDAVDAYAADRTGESRIKRCMQLHSRGLAHARRPVVLQIEDALLLSFRTDGFMKVDRFSNALFDRKAARSKRFKLANIAAVRISVAGKRPDLFDLVRLDPHHPRAYRRG